MEFAKEVVEERVENFIKTSRSNGMKVTPQRLEIFKELAATDEHPGVEEIYRRIIKKMPSVSLDTVYRTLSMFEEIGLAIKVEALCDRARYDADTADHQHFVCEKCGCIKDFFLADVASLIPDERRDELAKIGEITGMSIQLRGTCSECLKDIVSNN